MEEWCALHRPKRKGTGQNPYAYSPFYNVVYILNNSRMGYIAVNNSRVYYLLNNISHLYIYVLQ